MDAMHSSGRFSKWPIFSLVEPSFLRLVKLACVFGPAGNEAAMVSTDDDVFVSGSSCCTGSLGLAGTATCMQPRRVDSLCRKGIVTLSYGNGGPHILALTAEGEVYAWGQDTFGQLGLGPPPAATVPPRLTLPRLVGAGLVGIRVTQVACGGHHSLALSAAGEVFTWGFNNCGQIGNGSTVNQRTPYRVLGELGDAVCSVIACGYASSVAVTASGDLYTWGCNGNGQLGIGSNVNQKFPCHVRLSGMGVAQVCCGSAHMLALTNRGLLFGWGSNSYGQVGNGSKTGAMLPVQIGTELGCFIDVDACHCSHISTAVAKDGKVLMWGCCRGHTVPYPLETKFSSMEDVFAAFSSPACSSRPLTLEEDETGGLVKCIAERFNDLNTSDLTLVVEGRRIHVHKALLRMRCEYFDSMFQQGRWNEADKDVVDISQFSYPVFYAFLKYLYTDKLEDLSTEHLTGLLDLADSYCEAQLKKKCERLIWKRVSCDNAAELLSIADKYKAEYLEENCFRFALSHMTQVVNSEAFDNMEHSLAKQFIRRAAKRGIFKT